MASSTSFYRDNLDIHRRHIPAESLLLPCSTALIHTRRSPLFDTPLARA
jgi:hypothetical protein